MQLILFDCDGTLADSFGLISETMRRCFATANLAEPELAAIHGIIGLSLDRAIAQLAPTVPVEQLPELVQIYKSEFHKVRAGGDLRESLFPGIDAMLRALAAQDDILLGMVTGKSRRGVRVIMETHGLDSLFQIARTADDCPSKPHPAMVLECCDEVGVEPSETIVIGDAVYDMMMARSAGATALGVTWGAQLAPALLTAGAHETVDTVDDLVLCLDGWLTQRRTESQITIPLA